MSRRQVADVLDVSVTTLWRMVRRKDFPAPIRISPGRVGWCARIVWRWLADRSNLPFTVNCFMARGDHERVNVE